MDTALATAAEDSMEERQRRVFYGEFVGTSQLSVWLHNSQVDAGAGVELTDALTDEDGRDETRPPEPPDATAAVDVDPYTVDVTASAEPREPSVAVGTSVGSGGTSGATGGVDVVLEVPPGFEPANVQTGLIKYFVASD